MHPSTAQAEVLIDELARNDVRDVVLAPGSRNAPLSFALHRACQRADLRLHVRIDERSAGFLALGLAARRGAPAAVACTSGTATANLHPAVSEAQHSGTGLLLLTADRPPELRAAGANQTIDQNRLYGAEVRYFHEFAVAQDRVGQNAYWRSQVCRAVRAARGGELAGGPAHLNIPFEEPLVPGDDPGWSESLAGRDGGSSWMRNVDEGAVGPALATPAARRGIVLVAADLDPEAAERVDEWARRSGWPVLAETGGLGLSGGTAIGTGMWLLNVPEFLREHRPEQVVCVGRPTVFRQVQALLADSDVEVLLLHEDPVDWPAPAHDVREVARRLGPPASETDPDWLAGWQRADQKASSALDAALDVEEWPRGPVLARDLVEALPAESLLVLGSSNPTRDVALAARWRPDVRVHRNRGVAGIDGTVSTALGSALAHDGPACALLGDLTFLHDANGLLLGPEEQRPDLAIVVVNDDGGGIFSLLEQGNPEHAGSFERVFGTPHGTDLARLCAAHGVPHVQVGQKAELVEALRGQAGLRVVEVRADRSELRGVHERLRCAVSSAVRS